jgi:hypothetical protein
MLDDLGDVYRASGDIPAAHDAWQRAVTNLDAMGCSHAATVRGKLAEQAVV